MTKIQNPILKGFNPDPSILRVCDDYYIATSTFEWFPGVQISHSKDLKNWQVIARPLENYSQLDMRGCPNSGGVWAPCLSYKNGTFYLIYTNTRHWTGVFKDTPNYLVTAKNIEGPWSEPIYLNSSGFDPSLFHDDDGRSWLVNMLWDYRAEKHSFAGIVLQEFSEQEQKLVGPIKNIFPGTELQLVEGPHIYKRNGFYYLFVAEGGTFLTHAETVARAKSLEGPYEIHPQNPLISSAKYPELKLQSAGHASLVENQDGSWLLAHLCRRPLKNGRSILGRETSLQNIVWQDDWPYLASKNNLPQETFSPPPLKEQTPLQKAERKVFNPGNLDIEWQMPRVKFSEEFGSLSARPGFLRLYGRESIVSRFEQSLVARRQQAFNIEVTTCLEFDPENFQQLAGLVAFYNTDAFYYLYVTRGEHADRCLGLMSSEKGRVNFLIEKEYPLDNFQALYLRMKINRERISFYYSDNAKEWYAAGWEQDASVLSDEYALPCGFTGNFVGMACQDLSGQRKHADFAWFDYRELESSP